MNPIDCAVSLYQACESVRRVSDADDLALRIQGLDEFSRRVLYELVYHHVGAKNAITIEKLTRVLIEGAERMEEKDRDQAERRVRDAIMRIALQKIPVVVQVSAPYGAYIAPCDEDFQKKLHELDSRLRSTARRRAALLAAWGRPKRITIDEQGNLFEFPPPQSGGDNSCDVAAGGDIENHREGILSQPPPCESQNAQRILAHIQAIKERMGWNKTENEE